jgi:hypothetical protein
MEKENGSTTQRLFTDSTKEHDMPRRDVRLLKDIVTEFGILTKEVRLVINMIIIINYYIYYYRHYYYVPLSESLFV